MDGLYFNIDDEEEEEAEEEHYLEDEEYEPSEQEIIEYCEWLGMDPNHDRQLMWIAREALKAPLPDNWKICYTEDREVYYFNVRSGESIWDHPMDAYYKALFRQEKTKLEQKRKKMRLYSGSFAILPLQEYFSQLSEEEEEHNCVGSAGIDIPDHLTDPIDCRLYVDPVVLPTSGRTVSKHTIVNNKWRDPFSREYIENRRLIPNIDKRNEVIAWLEMTTKKHIQQLFAEGSLLPILKLMPYLLDKECEVSLKTQGMLLAHFHKLFITVVSSPSYSPDSIHAKTMPNNHPNAAQPYSSSQTVHSSTVNGRVHPGDTINDASDECDFEGNIFSPTGATTTSSSSTTTTSTSCHDQKLGPNINGLRHPTVTGAQNQQITRHSHGYLQVARLSADEVTTLLGSLLTMSTTTSSEMLYLLLDSVPQLRCAPVLRGFSAEILNVLRISPTDILHLVTANVGDFGPSCPTSSTGTNGPFHMRHHPVPSRLLNHSEFGSVFSHHRPGSAENEDDYETDFPHEERCTFNTSLKTSNADQLVCLKWILLLMDVPMHLNVLERLEWEVSVHVLILIFNSIPDAAKSRIGLLCRLLRGAKGWPLRLHICPPSLLQWFVDLTMLDTNPWHQILLLYDILINGANGGIECIKTRKEMVVQALFQATESNDKNSEMDAEQSVTYASMLGALLVFLDCCKLSDFSSSRALELSIAYDLFPRLTRQQWRPRHFEQTVQEILNCISIEPAIAWAIMGSKAVEFLIKELSKKKKNSEALRLKLETIEGTEKRLQASNSVVSWALMYLKLHVKKEDQISSANGKKSIDAARRLDLLLELTHRNERKRQEIASERINNLVLLLQTLLAVRLKPKQSRERAGNGNSNGTVTTGDRKASTASLGMNDTTTLVGDPLSLGGDVDQGIKSETMPPPSTMAPPLANPNSRRRGRTDRILDGAKMLHIDPLAHLPLQFTEGSSHQPLPSFRTGAGSGNGSMSFLPAI